ncbi:hypothetical protein ACLOJK_009869 [Asimina triloba]
MKGTMKAGSWGGICQMWMVKIGRWRIWPWMCGGSCGRDWVLAWPRLRLPFAVACNSPVLRWIFRLLGDGRRRVRPHVAMEDGILSFAARLQPLSRLLVGLTMDLAWGVGQRCGSDRGGGGGGGGGTSSLPMVVACRRAPSPVPGSSHRATTPRRPDLPSSEA